MVNHRRAVLTATGVVAALAVWATVGNSGESDEDPARAATGPATTAATGSPSPSPSPSGGDPSTSGGTAGDAAAEPSTDPSSAAGTGDPGDAGDADDSGHPGGSGSSQPSVASELLPSPSTDADGGYTLPNLPSSSGDEPLVAGRLPRPGFARGRLVAGFPQDLAPPSGSEVRSTSVSVSGDVVQAALVARTTGDPDRYLLHYRQVMRRHGFAEARTRAPSNARAVAFRHGKDAVTVTVGDGQCHVLAVLRPKGADG